MRQGDLVRLRGYEGQELVRRLVAVNGDILLICREEEYQAAQREERDPVCVGFRREDLISHQGAPIAPGHCASKE